MTAPLDTVSTVVPTMKYRDADAAIDFLVRAFGFEAQAVYRDNGKVLHAQLTFGRGMIMLSSVGVGGAYDARIAQPDDVGGRETQMCCVAVADPAAHYERAKAAGARITDPLEVKDYGGSGYGCADPEGHLWWFGSYDPWSPPPNTQ